MDHAINHCGVQLDQHSQLVLNRINSFWKSNELTDVTLVCQDGTLIQAHKLVLAATSDYFRKIFSQCPPQNNPIIVCGGKHFDHMESIVKFIYQGENQLREDHLRDFRQACKDFQIGPTDHIKFHPLPRQPISSSNKQPATDAIITTTGAGNPTDETPATPESPTASAELSFNTPKTSSLQPPPKKRRVKAYGIASLPLNLSKVTDASSKNGGISGFDVGSSLNFEDSSSFSRMEEDFSPRASVQDFSELATQKYDLISRQHDSSDFLSNQGSSSILSKQDSSSILSKQDSSSILSKQDSLQILSKQDSLQILSKQDSLQILSKQDAAPTISIQDSLSFLSKHDSSTISLNRDSQKIPYYDSLMISLEQATSTGLPERKFSQIVPKQDSSTILTKQDSSTVILNSESSINLSDRNSSVNAKQNSNDISNQNRNSPEFLSQQQGSPAVSASDTYSVPGNTRWKVTEFAEQNCSPFYDDHCLNKSMNENSPRSGSMVPDLSMGQATIQNLNTPKKTSVDDDDVPRINGVPNDQNQNLIAAYVPSPVSTVVIETSNDPGSTDVCSSRVSEASAADQIVSDDGRDLLCEALINFTSKLKFNLNVSGGQQVDGEIGGRCREIKQEIVMVPDIADFERSRPHSHSPPSRLNSSNQINSGISSNSRNDSGDHVARNDSEGQAARNDSEGPAARNDSEGPAARNDSGGQAARNDSGGQAARNDSGCQTARNDSGGQAARNDLECTRNDSGDQATRNDSGDQAARNDTGGQVARCDSGCAPSYLEMNSGQNYFGNQPARKDSGLPARFFPPTNSDLDDVLNSSDWEKIFTGHEVLENFCHSEKSTKPANQSRNNPFLARQLPPYADPPFQYNPKPYAYPNPFMPPEFLGYPPNFYDSKMLLADLTTKLSAPNRPPQPRPKKPIVPLKRLVSKSPLVRKLHPGILQHQQQIYGNPRSPKKKNPPVSTTQTLAPNGSHNNNDNNNYYGQYMSKNLPISFLRNSSVPGPTSNNNNNTGAVKKPTINNHKVSCTVTSSSGSYESSWPLKDMPDLNRFCQPNSTGNDSGEAGTTTATAGSASQKSGNKTTKSKKTTQYTCNICDRPFIYFKAYQEHLNSHMTATAIRCPVCRKTFASRGFLDRHLVNGKCGFNKMQNS